LKFKRVDVKIEEKRKMNGKKKKIFGTKLESCWPHESPHHGGATQTIQMSVAAKTWCFVTEMSNMHHPLASIACTRNFFEIIFNIYSNTKMLLGQFDTIKQKKTRMKEEKTLGR